MNLWGVLAFLQSYGVLVFAAIALAVGLGYLAFILRYWKLAAFAALIIVAACYQGKAYKDGYDKAWEEVAAAREKILKERNKVLEEANAADDEQRKKDQEELELLRKKAKDTPENTTVCLPGEVAVRIGEIK